MRDIKTVIESRPGHFFLEYDIGNFVSKSLVLKASVGKETRNAIKIYEKSLGVIISYLVDFSGRIRPLVLVNDKDDEYHDILMWDDPIVPGSEDGGCGAECFNTESELFTNFGSVLLELDRIFGTRLSELKMRLEISGKV
jgi:hypothetical protein